MRATNLFDIELETSIANAESISEDELDDAVDAKQDALVSGTNIKTVNGTSLLGSGDVSTVTPVTTVNDADYTATTTSGVIVFTNLTAPRTVNLPTTAGNTGLEIIVKDGAVAAATHNITVDGNGSQTIDGSATVVINTDWGKIRLKATSAGWVTI